MKKLNLILLIILFVLTLSVIAACTDKVVLKFVTADGTQIPDVKIKKGTDYTLPVPQREGYEFEGWFVDVETSGTALTNVTAESNTTFYAKWGKLYDVVFNLNGGTLSTAKIQLKAGANVYDAVSQYIPSKNGLTFGAWFNGSNELTQNFVMPKNQLTLTAKYKVDYTVELFLETIEGGEYQQADIITGRDYVGKNFVYENAPIGFELAENESAITSVVLNENASQNVLRLYCDRKTHLVNFIIEYPDGTDDDTVSLSVRYGNNISVLTDLAAEGYNLYGWYSEEDSDTIYKTNKLDAISYNVDIDDRADADTITPQSDMILHPIWQKAYINMFGGDDKIYIDNLNDDVIYCQRGDMVFKGVLNTQAQEFAFSDQEQNVVLSGKIIDEDIFCFDDAERSELTYTRYIAYMGLEDTTTIRFDNFNGITYETGSTGSTSTSIGTFYIEENYLYVADFYQGELAGKTISFILGKAEDTNVFKVRNDDEINLGELICFTVNNFRLVSYNNLYQIRLDGFGTAQYNAGSSTVKYGYIYEDETITLIDSNGQILKKARVITAANLKGYINYIEDLDNTYTADEGATLILDGMFSATYSKGSTLISGVYSCVASAFGGYVVTIKSNDTVYTFLTSISENGQTKAYTFESKDAVYAEYWYKDSQDIYYSPLLVITKTGKAEVYVRRTSIKTYEKISSGNFIKDSQNGLYIYIATQVFDTSEDAYKKPLDMSQIKVFVFALDETTLTVKVHYWYSYETTLSETTDLPVERYSTSSGQLTLVAGFALLTVGDTTVTGIYYIGDGYLTIVSPMGSVYIELNEEQESFTILNHKPFLCNERLIEGTISQDNTLYLDGKGGAILNTSSTGGNAVQYIGTITKSNRKTSFGLDIYVFASEEIEFDLLLLSDGSSNYFARYNENINGTYSDSINILTLDGFSFDGQFSDGEKNRNYSGRYVIVEENLICLTFVDETEKIVKRYFDLNSNRSFTIRGLEFGVYAFRNNTALDGKYFELDGYGKLAVFTLSTDNDGKLIRNYIDDDGTYTQNGQLYEFVYRRNSSTLSLMGKLNNVLVNDTYINTVDLYYEDIDASYINESDWSTLILDGSGFAVRYSKFGVKTLGQYVLITDEILYFDGGNRINSAMYKYNTQSRTATAMVFDEYGYYTAQLDYIKLYAQGIAEIGTEHYYYYIENNNVTLYRRANENQQADTAFGFVMETLGALTQQLTYNSKTYYKNSGIDICFARAEEDNGEFPYIRNADKYQIKELIFAPEAASEYSVSGMITVDFGTQEKNINCVVVCTPTEMYISVGLYRYYISVVYGGQATFSITALEYIEVLEEITLVRVLDQAGEETAAYVNAIFDDNQMTDTLGNTVKITEQTFSYNAENGLYTVAFTAADGYVYKIHFIVSGNGYNLYAFTRLETLKDGIFDVTVERVIKSHYPDIATGMFYDFSLKKETTPIDAEIYLINQVCVYVIERSIVDGKIVSSTIYKVDFEKSNIIDTSVILFASVSVTELNVDTIYTADGKSYADISVESGVVFMVLTVEDQFGRDITKRFIVNMENTEFDAETSTYTVETKDGKHYMIQIIRQGGAEYITIQQII